MSALNEVIKQAEIRVSRSGKSWGPEATRWGWQRLGCRWPLPPSAFAELVPHHLGRTPGVGAPCRDSRLGPEQESEERNGASLLESGSFPFTVSLQPNAQWPFQLGDS